MSATRDTLFRVRRRAGRRAGQGIAKLGGWGLERLPVSIEHYFDFGPDGERVGRVLASAESWDALRSSPGRFGIPGTREAWERSADDPGLRARAETIAARIRASGARRVCSYGVGGATLELNLLRASPELELVCTEYAPRTVAALGSLFPEADIVSHDLRNEAPLPADLHLFHRVDTEFANGDWEQIFARFRVPILLVAGTLLDWDRLLLELRMRRLPRATRAGWVRTRPALERLWRKTHLAERLAVGDLPGYALTPR